MKKLIISSLLFTLIVSTPFAFSKVNAINSEDKGVVTVSYTAEKEVTPDTVELSVAIKTTDKSSMNEAVKKNKEISDKVYNYLKGFINTSNGDYIKTSNYSANPTYRYFNGQRNITGYEVSNNVIIHTKNIEKISDAINKSISLGATNVDSLSFSLSSKDKECSELLASATKQTKQRAELIATSAGSALFGIKSIDTSCSVNRRNSVSYFRNSVMMAKNADGAEEISENGSKIEAGVVTIYSTVNASYFLK